MRKLVNAAGLPPRKERGRFLEAYGLLLADNDGTELLCRLVWQIRHAQDPHLYAAMRREWRWDLSRLWKFDLAWPQYKVAAEIEGGLYMTLEDGKSGQHARGRGYEDNCLKYNAAQIAGWIVLRYGPNHVNKEPGRCIADITAALGRRGWPGEPADTVQAPATAAGA